MLFLLVWSTVLVLENYLQFFSSSSTAACLIRDTFNSTPRHLLLLPGHQLYTHTYIHTYTHTSTYVAIRDMEPPDDWVDGSWTVDCVCGVNFDDGEEMVDCDECGVWVHTRCSRYVKSEKVFACHKCRRRKRGEEGCEVEVADVLVEMPNKSEENVGFRRRVWTRVPREERAHVQGGLGDGGVCGSGIFGAGLWKASGYVPKKFGFQYKEFECWDGDNEVGSGEGVRLLKDKVGGGGDSVGFGAGKRVQEEGSEKKEGAMGEDSDVRSNRKNGVKKDRSLMKSSMIYSGKRKKEDSRTSKDVGGKKKARGVHVERDDSKKRSPLTSRSVSTPSSDAKHSEFHEGKGSKVDKNVIRSGKHEKIKGNVTAQPSSKGFPIKGVGVDEIKNTLATSGQTSETSCVMSTHRLSLKARQKDERDGLTAATQNSSKVGDGVQLLLDCNDSRSRSANNEDNIDLDTLKDSGRCINRSDQIRTEHLYEKESVAHHVKDSQNDHGSNGNMSLSCSKQDRAQVDINDSVGALPQKLNDLDKHTVAVDCQIYNEVAPSEPIICQINGQLVGLDNSHLVKESSLELEEVRHTREPSESRGATFISSGQLTKDKMVVSLKKSSSTSATTLLSRTKYSDSRKTFEARDYKRRTPQNVVSEIKTSKKDSSAGGFVKDRERYEKSTSLAKELLESFTSSVKTSNQSKITGSSNFTKTLSESKESINFRSAKPSLLQNISSNPMSGESASSLQPDSASYVDNTTTTSLLMQRSETVDHLNLQVHHSSAPNTLATIRDEELALLLHQELNSSARVPRVPRMRHAGSLPQLASPTGANMLMKQSPSSSVGKDHGSVFKRKGKSIAIEGTQNSQELQDESKYRKRSPLLPVQRTNDLAHTEDSVTKKEVGNGSALGIQSANKSNPPATSKQNVSSKCKSVQNASDDDTGTGIRIIRRTLPGLLSEIITKPMTYKELCDAVLPHWPYLRKNNGERYAYSSHSQAVLDCLRSRSEWARLVDRGPKSNAGRKRRRRRFDAEAPSFDSEDNDSNKKNSEGADCKSVVKLFLDQIPKGKRKMRKRRRRLALQERGLKNMIIRRSKQKETDDVSHNEDSSLSSSSSEEESMSSEDETIQLDDGTSSNGGRSEFSASE
ncbi:hypothetical protein POM88_042627 [Heracleum sosnowskyi]|uniref:Zinc finger PHD-type domain-containing protein n=1 Tax=Heracleum sosnowskyi TaxID=360622 RepID=A0AAD8MAT9_9APIA|nr:hypothetical protein POM88_042627 [Heracleum sosnowskyi]